MVMPKGYRKKERKFSTAEALLAFAALDTAFLVGQRLGISADAARKLRERLRAKGHKVGFGKAGKRAKR